LSISIRTKLASRIKLGGSPFSIRAVPVGFHARFPVTIRDIVTLLEPITLTIPLNSGFCAGSCTITLSSDGSGRYTGNVHDSGGVAVSYDALTQMEVENLGAVVIAHQGTVGGTLSVQSRDDNWDEGVIDEARAAIADNWVALKAASGSARTTFGTNFSSIDAIEALFAAGTALFLFKL
jgi:hypothetical protein